MKIELRESYPGELQELDPREIEQKVHDALHACCDQLIKGRKPHAGVPTIKAIDELADQVSGLYEERMKKMMREAAKYDPKKHLDFTE